jgi:hypothetical protein
MSVFFGSGRNSHPEPHRSGETCLYFPSLSFHQCLLGHHLVTQRTGHKQPMHILGQTALAHLAEAKLPLDKRKLMFHPGPYPRLVAIAGAIFRRQLTIAAAFGLREVFGSRCLLSLDLLLTRPAAGSTRTG